MFFEFEDKLTADKAENGSLRSKDERLTSLIDDHEKAKKLIVRYAKTPEGDDNSDVKKGLVAYKNMPQTDYLRAKRFSSREKGEHGQPHWIKG